MLWLKKLTLRERYAIALAFGAFVFCWWFYDPVNLWNYRRIDDGMTYDEVVRVFGVEGVETPFQRYSQIQHLWGTYESLYRASFFLPGGWVPSDPFVPCLEGHRIFEWTTTRRRIVVVLNGDDRVVGAGMWWTPASWERLMPSLTARLRACWG